MRRRRRKLSCRPGEITACWVQNGAGKFTTLRILADSRATEGTAIVAGFDAARFPQEVRARSVSLRRHGALRAPVRAEMVEYFGRLHGLDEPTLRHGDGIFTRLEIDDFRDRRCDRLSDGMKVSISAWFTIPT
jgi:sodium transport system ATP-binding protein